MDDFKEKLQSLQFTKVRSKKVKDKETGRVLGEQHYHINGSVGATVQLETNELKVKNLPVGT